MLSMATKLKVVKTYNITTQNVDIYHIMCIDGGCVYFLTNKII